MKLLVEDPKSPLDYDEIKRAYFLDSVPRAYRKENEVCDSYPISHCPDCGKKLPKDLSNEWEALAAEQLNVESPLDIDIEALPEEFKSDEWWRERGFNIWPLSYPFVSFSIRLNNLIEKDTNG